MKNRISAIAFLAIATSTSAASAGNGITIEAVNNYSACNGPSLANSIADAVGFRNTMIGSINPAGFVAGNAFTDSNVWTSDFFDPQRTGIADDDSTNFDRSVDAVSYFAGHGTCVTGDSGQACSTSSQCTSPIAGAQMPGFCRRLPGDNFGNCSYTRMQRELAVGNCTSGAGAAARGGRINYSSGLVRWGESSSSGSWGGAGTNGGTNAVLNHSSCAEMSNRGQEIWPAFAGIHFFGNVLVHSGDTANIQDRGTNFALSYVSYPSGSAADDWTSSMSSNAQRNNFCTNFWGSQVYGGGYGINGCGGHVVTALGATSAEAVGHLNENWYALKDDANDGKGGTFWASRYNCNYDCWTWPFSI